MNSITKFRNKALALAATAICLLQLNSQNAQAQNVGIGASSFTPDPQSILEVQSTTKGVLIPRMTDVQRVAVAPSAGSDYGMLVYQTNTVSSANSAGYWYWDGSSWLKLTSGIDWNTLGNSNTNASTNFIGTADANDFVMRTSNIERARIKSTGFVGIGTSTPSQMLSVYKGMNIDQENVNNGTLTNALIFGSGGSVEGIASNRLASSPNQYGLDFYTGSSNKMCITWGGNVGIGTTNPSGMLEVINPSSSRGAFINNTSASNSNPALRVDHDGTGTGIYCTAAGASATGFYCAQGGVTPFSSVGVGSGGMPSTVNYSTGKGISSGGTNVGVEGYAQEDGNTSTDQIGGSFYVKSAAGNIGAFACVGAIVDNIQYKIIGLGAVSTIVNDMNEKPVVMAAPEAPEMLFQDFGTGELLNGKAHITLDAILAKNITVNERHPVKIFIQLNDECNGVFVNNKDGKGFDVTELSNGKSNAKFSWMLTATRKNETRDGITSDYESFRFKRTNFPGFNNSSRESAPLMDAKTK